MYLVSLNKENTKVGEECISDEINWQIMYFVGEGGGGGGGGGRGGGNGDNFGTCVRASIPKPTQFIYLTFENGGPIHILDRLKCWPIHILAVDFCTHYCW